MLCPPIAMQEYPPSAVQIARPKIYAVCGTMLAANKIITCSPSICVAAETPLLITILERQKATAPPGSHATPVCTKSLSKKQGWLKKSRRRLLSPRPDLPLSHPDPSPASRSQRQWAEVRSRSPSSSRSPASPSLHLQPRAALPSNSPSLGPEARWCFEAASLLKRHRSRLAKPLI